MLGGDPAIDFINTASDWASGDPIDRLGGIEGFADWVEIAGLVSPAEGSRLKKEIAAHAAEAAATFEAATTLRAALRRIFTTAAQGGRVDAADLSILKNLACRARPFRDLEQTDDGFEERWTRDAPPLETPLLELALAAEQLLKDGPLERIRNCGGCEWMFLDLSKNASRRWCSMATCGNSAKVRKFRKRTKAAVS
jgi:predicted RNA-binding Zn ribbon-like protein